MLDFVLILNSYENARCKKCGRGIAVGKKVRWVKSVGVFCSDNCCLRYQKDSDKWSRLLSVLFEAPRLTAERAMDKTDDDFRKLFDKAVHPRTPVEEARTSAFIGLRMLVKKGVELHPAGTAERIRRLDAILLAARAIVEEP